ncbi:acyl carrier protein [Streptomyces flaveolus]|uniref:acyl carrier protein n=1 Tax=Streptomyces flaveolus TaxID=67297 RepID=UPI0036F87F61
MTLKDEVLEYFAETLSGSDIRAEDITLDTSLDDNALEFDTRGALWVSMVDERFAVSMDDATVEGFKTIGDMVDYIVARYK